MNNQFFLKIFFIFTILISSEIILGIDLGTENAHAALLGGKFNFHVLQTQSGKRSFPALVVLEKVRRYCGEEAFQKV